MKIRLWLTILFTFITAAILLVFAAYIYLSAKQSREKEFYNLLNKEALTKVNLFLNAHVDAGTLHTIYRNNRKILNEVEVAIYDTSFNLLYHDAVDLDFVKETRGMIDEIVKKKEIRFYQENWQVIGISYHFKDKDYVITAAGYDEYGYSKLSNLLTNICIVFVLSILIIYLAGWFFVKRAFAPVSEITRKVKNISATNLDLRLDTNKSKDELSQLSSTFNEMLNRLEDSFDAQKHFVANISHELRTPLSAIITELELSQIKERSLEEYKTVVQQALSDAKKLARLSNSLLDFAKASYDLSEIHFKALRLDELLLDAQLQLQKTNPDYDIDILFEKEFDDDDLISVKGNAYLLQTAFVNLIENGCKFSPDKQCVVAISFQEANVILKFSDKGIGIPPEDLSHIFVPFYRGSNQKMAEGNGIGLPMTQKIIALHKGNIFVQSDIGKGTVFTIEIPHL
ncbi:ATP-binding protein [Pedobacter nutrimenti]|jgi:signal transduction histidine kinase|uniref:histidine kinase n=1 Tax=Pedobacter nutrimenti TaxID=1241337 RepID=A0A318UIF1_9SPHI|nr:ATP-binding protein [Pedobacter nutrimenti]PYF72864.1 signal transduction histidine kinase [Pedobacter nutrimenti]